MKNILTTSRLYLREFTVDDATNFYLLNKDRDVIKYTGDVAFISISEAKTFLKNYTPYQDFGYGRWAVCKKENNGFIGFCGLKYHYKEQITEVGFRFFKKFWNQGFATESALACINYGFSEFNLDKIYAHAHIENVASQRVIEKCGLHFVKELYYDNQLAKLYCIENPF